MGLRGTFKNFSDCLTPGNGAVPCAGKSPFSKLSIRENHSCATSPPTVSFLSGGKPRGKDEVGQFGGAQWISNVRRWGSRIRWFCAASDSGISQINDVRHGLYRKTSEERKSLTSVQGIMGPLRVKVVTSSPDSNVREGPAGWKFPAGRIPLGFQGDSVEMRMLFKPGEKNIS